MLLLWRFAFHDDMFCKPPRASHISCANFFPDALITSNQLKFSTKLSHHPCDMGMGLLGLQEGG